MDFEEHTLRHVRMILLFPQETSHSKYWSGYKQPKAK